MKNRYVRVFIGLVSLICIICIEPLQAWMDESVVGSLIFYDSSYNEISYLEVRPGETIPDILISVAGVIEQNSIEKEVICDSDQIQCFVNGRYLVLSVSPEAFPLEDPIQITVNIYYEDGIYQGCFWVYVSGSQETEETEETDSTEEPDDGGGNGDGSDVSEVGDGGESQGSESESSDFGVSENSDSFSEGLKTESEETPPDNTAILLPKETEEEPQSIDIKASQDKPVETEEVVILNNQEHLGKNASYHRVSVVALDEPAEELMKVETMSGGMSWPMLILLILGTIAGAIRRLLDFRKETRV